ncbi:MAG: hypothetical protein PHD82_09885 [Candidatus Riflebacteria bacterium]|jgi:hypothetical protein|nr:hypothetical protein [Candidatus Riflebacteria bacterium]
MNDNKHLIIAAVVAILSVFILAWMLTGRKSHKQQPVRQTAVSEKPVSQKWQKDDEPVVVSSRPAHTSSSGGATMSPFSQAELEEMKARDKENEKLIEKAATSWLMNMANDDTIAEKTREKYKLKLNKAYVDATNAKKQKNYPLAVKKFYEAIKAPESTPVSKYYSLLNIKTAALKMKDMELFIVASRLEAKLIAEENLSTLGIAKSKEQLEWIDSFEKLLKARTDPAILDELVQKRMEFHKGKYPREAVEQMIFKEAEHYDKIFKELMG